MARPYTYTRSRRILSQVVLIGVLGGTLGVAALVRHARVGPSGVPLTVRFQLGPVVGTLPGWDIGKGRRANDHLLTALLYPDQPFIVATEPADRRRPAAGGRRLEVTQQVALPSTPAIDHLRATVRIPPGGDVRPARAFGEDARGAVAAVPDLRPDRSADDRPAGRAYGAAVGPRGTAMVVELTVPGRVPDERDVALVRQVLETFHTGQLADDKEGTLPAR